jgi:hypothetical protein
MAPHPKRRIAALAAAPIQMEPAAIDDQPTPVEHELTAAHAVEITRHPQRINLVLKFG